MNGNPFTFELTSSAFWRWGRAALVGALAFGVALVLWLAWRAPMSLPLLPAALLAGVAVWYLVQRPLLHLCIVVSSSVALFSMSDGVSAFEVIYGLYYLCYLGGWLVHHIFFRKERIFRSAGDKALLLYLLYTVVALGIGVFVYGGKPLLAFREWMVVTVWLFYFPIKEAIRRDPRAIQPLLWSFSIVVLFVVVRNFLVFRTGLHDAATLQQLALDRIKQNERVLFIGFLGALTYLLHTNRLWRWLMLAMAALVLLVSLVITKARGAWLATILGVGVVFLLIGRREKMKFAISVVAITGAILVIGILFFQNLFFFFFEQFSNRFATVGNAASKDISLINRFYEWSAIWSYIKVNPLLGYGPGVNFETYNVISNITSVKTQVHNAYLQRWYQYGFIGMSLLLFTYAHNFWRGLLAFWRSRGASVGRLAALACLASMTALALVSMVESMRLNDMIFELCIPLSLLAGWWQREQLLQEQNVSTARKQISE